MRSKETIQQELTETRTRLSAYLAREADMLSKDGVQLYTIGSRNLQRYQTSLASVQDMIAKLQKRVRELEAELAGGSAFAPLDTAAAAVFNYLQGGEKNEVRPNEGAISPG